MWTVAAVWCVNIALFVTTQLIHDRLIVQHYTLYTAGGRHHLLSRLAGLIVSFRSATLTPFNSSVQFISGVDFLVVWLRNQTSFSCWSAWVTSRQLVHVRVLFGLHVKVLNRHGTNGEEQEAQLPQRNSASAAHDWLTDRAMHRTPQKGRCCTTML